MDSGKSFALPQTPADVFFIRRPDGIRMALPAWLPAGWQSHTCPASGGDASIRSWLEWRMECAKVFAMFWPADGSGAGQADLTDGRDARRLVEHLRKQPGFKATPERPVPRMPRRFRATRKGFVGLGFYLADVLDWVETCLRQQRKAARTKGKMTLAEAERVVAELLKNRRVEWSIRKLAGDWCSEAQVRRTKAYQEWNQRRKAKKPAAPKAVPLTPAVLANEGRRDIVLQELAADAAEAKEIAAFVAENPELCADFKADYEPSPTDPAPGRGKRRRCKL